jgi:WD domain, G-beta repeat
LPTSFAARSLCATLPLLAALAGGCSKQKESLVVVSLTSSDANAGAADTVALSIASVVQTFALPAGLSQTSLGLGVYLPSSETGILTVSASATGGGFCFAGSTTASVPSAGSTVMVSLPLTATAGCTASGGGGTSGTGGVSGSGGGGRSGTGGSSGSSGSGGATGAGGMAGTGSGGAITPPSLTACTEYDHNDVSDPTCNDDQGISNWEIWSLAFSPDGSLLATAGDDGRVKIWNFDGHTLTASGHVISTNGQTYVAFSPDGSTLVAGSNGALVTYKTANWTLGPAFTGVTGQVRGVAVTADSQRIVTIDGAENLYVHTLVSGGAPVVYPIGVYPLSLSLEAGSSATKIVAGIGFDTGRAETLQISGSTISPLSAFTVETSTSVDVLAAAFAPTGTLLALGDDDGDLQFWANPVSNGSASGTALTFATKGNANAVDGLSWSRDGAYLAIAAGSPFAGGSASIYAYPARTQYAAVVPTYYPVSVAFSPSGSALAIGEVTCGKVMICAD